MIGVFDSGIGGIAALSELKEIYPDADLIYLADREHAPYGTKSSAELITCVGRCIDRLCRAGADRILIACCTASTVYENLPLWQREITTPIISAAANIAATLTKSKHISVIATDMTVASHAFSRAILKVDPEITVREHPLQSLVGMVESGVRDGNVTKKQKEKIKDLILGSVDGDTDTLILGCTHFSHLEMTVGDVLGEGVRIVNAAREGARAIPKPRSGSGVIRYL